MEVNTSNVVYVLRKEYDEWIKLLTSKEKHTIEKYSWNSFDRKHGNISFFARLNSMLRGVSSYEHVMLNEYADILSQAISKHRLEHSVVCYRGSDFDITDNVKVGKTFESSQFISTSVRRSKIIKSKYKYIIHVPKGAYVSYIENLSVYKKQRELLIDRNTVFRVILRNGYLIELEVMA